MQIRRATPSDLPGILDLRASLAYAGDSQGGFLLGTDAKGYLEHIATAHTWVLDDGAIRGLAIVLGDAGFRRSDIYARRADVRWSIQPEAYLSRRLAYYDQLGVARGPYRRWGAALAFTALADGLSEADHAVTTTVHAPVCNLAAVPYIERLSGRRVGRIDEVYPDFGPLISDVWLIDAPAFVQRYRQPRGLAEAWVVDRADEALHG